MQGEIIKIKEEEIADKNTEIEAKNNRNWELTDHVRFLKRHVQQQADLIDEQAEKLERCKARRLALLDVTGQVDSSSEDI